MIAMTLSKWSECRFFKSKICVKLRRRLIVLKQKIKGLRITNLFKVRPNLKDKDILFVPRINRKMLNKNGQASTVLWKDPKYLSISQPQMM